MMRRKAVVFAILTAALLCFIWGQSLTSADASQDESMGIVAWLKPILDPQGRVDDEVFHHAVRKAAHFSEFAALGFCMCGLFLSLPWKGSDNRLRAPAAPAALAACALTACIDECIQLFNPGRSPKLTDVLLDTCGAAFGIAVLLLISFITHKRKKTAG